MSCRWLWLVLVVATPTTCVWAWEHPTERSLTLSELPSIDPSTPILRVTLATIDPANASWVFGTNVWVRYGTGPWQLVYRPAEGGADVSRPGQPVFNILLTGTPTAVRVGCVGYYTGPVMVDDIALVLPDGSAVSPTSACAINNAAAPAQAIGADGRWASVSHLAGPTPAIPTIVDAVEVVFDKVPAPYRSTALKLPTVSLPPARFGLYHIAGGDADPHESLPGWYYRPDAAQHAFYDFLVPQSNNPALFAEIRKANPGIKIIARLTWPGTNPLDYCYKLEERKKIEAAIREQLARGTAGLYGVYLGDEEPAHFLHGWYSGGPPEWATRYADTYRQETGAPFDWNQSKCRDWIIGKGRALWDDLYRIIKEADPTLKVMPFLYVPGDISGWGVWEPGTIKADGWICQWYYNDKCASVKVPLVTPRAGVTEVLTRDSWFNASVRKIVNAGVPPEELYCQIWAYRPGDDPVDQTEWVRRAGLSNIWVFYTCAWLPPKPVVMPALRDAAFRLTARGDTRPWLAQDTSNGFVGAGLGLAQRFVAGRDSLTTVGLRLKATAAAAYTLQLLPVEDGRPATRPLAAAPVTVAAGFDDWLQVPLVAPLAPGKTYALALVPEGTPPGATLGLRAETDTAGPLLWATDFRDPYSGGELVHREVYGDYYRDWRLYGAEAAGTWIGSWRASYEQRQVWEAYIRDQRRGR